MCVYSVLTESHSTFTDWNTTYLCHPNWQSCLFVYFVYCYPCSLLPSLTCLCPWSTVPLFHCWVSEVCRKVCVPSSTIWRTEAGDDWSVAQWPCLLCCQLCPFLQKNVMLQLCLQLELQIEVVFVCCCKMRRQECLLKWKQTNCFFVRILATGILALEGKLKIQYWFQQHHGAILSVWNFCSKIFVPELNKRHFSDWRSCAVSEDCLVTYLIDLLCQDREFSQFPKLPNR